MVTIKQIAAEIGVSPSTVSIVLSGKAVERKISEETTALVLQAASSMGYKPSLSARRLKGGYGSEEIQIGVFWSQDLRAPVLGRFMEGIRQQIQKYDTPINIGFYPYQCGNLKAVRHLFTGLGFHGVIICHATAEDLKCLREEADRINIPVVIHNRICDQFSYITTDHAMIGQLAANALADNGCKRVACINHSGYDSDLDIRTRSFCEQAQKRGMSVEDIFCCGKTAVDSRELMTSIFMQYGTQGLPDGLFCGSSMIAHGVIRALWDKSVQVPRDIKVVAVGNGSEDDDACSIPSLSIVRIFLEEIASECLFYLISTINGTAERKKQIVLPVEYLPRESCGPLRPTL